MGAIAPLGSNHSGGVTPVNSYSQERIWIARLSRTGEDYFSSAGF
jgi:hypothetical protein